MNESTLWWVRVFPVRVSLSWVRELRGEWKCSVVSGNAPWWVKVLFFTSFECGQCYISGKLSIKFPPVYEEDLCISPFGFLIFVIFMRRMCQGWLTGPGEKKKTTWDISIQPRSDTFMGSLNSSQNSSCVLWMSIEMVCEIAIASGKGVVSPWQPLQRLKNSLYGDCFLPLGIGIVCFIATGKWWS